MGPHPNDKQAQVRELRKKLRRALNYIPNTMMPDAMAKAALEAASARIDELERELEQFRYRRDRADQAILRRYD